MHELVTGLGWRAGLTAGSATLTALSVVPYTVAIRRGTLRPQRTSWFVFAVLSAVAAASQFAAGAGSGAWLSLGSAIGFGTVFALTVRAGVGGRSPSDLFTLGLTATSVVVWLTTGRPLFGIVAVVIAEIAAVVLTVRKEHTLPGTERPESWAIDAVAGVLALAAVPAVTFAQVLYPLHHTIVNGWVVATVARSRRHCGPGTRRWRGPAAATVTLPTPPSRRCG